MFIEEEDGQRADDMHAAASKDASNFVKAGVVSVAMNGGRTCVRVHNDCLRPVARHPDHGMLTCQFCPHAATVAHSQSRVVYDVVYGIDDGTAVLWATALPDVASFLIQVRHRI